MNNIIIKVISKYSNYWIVTYEGTESKEKVVNKIQSILEPYEKIIEVSIEETNQWWSIQSRVYEP
jgi:hypothetical protein